MRTKGKEGEHWVWFYWEGWRFGKIIKRYSNTLMTVKDCRKSRHRVQKLDNGKWLAVSSKEFKGQNHLRKKEKKHGKKKIKVAGKRRFKIKTAKRKLRKIRKITKAT